MPGRLPTIYERSRVAMMGRLARAPRRHLAHTGCRRRAHEGHRDVVHAVPRCQSGDPPWSLR